LQSIDTFFASFSPFYTRVEEKGRKQRIKGKTMAQWIQLLWNNSFINQTRLPFLGEKSGAIALVLLGLMAGKQAGWLADEIVLNLENFKIIYWIKYLNFRYV